MGVNKVVYGTTTIIDISDSTITKNKILKGYKGYGANGDEVVGDIETVDVARPTITSTACDEDGEICIEATNNQPEGYVKGIPAYSQVYATLTVSGDTAIMKCGNAETTRKVFDPNLIAANIKKGVTIFGVTGTYENSNNGDFPLGDIVVRNHSNSTVLVASHFDIGVFPEWYNIDTDSEEYLNTAKQIPLYIIGNAPLDCTYNEEECQCVGQDNVLCVLLTADYTEIDIYDA